MSVYECVSECVGWWHKDLYAEKAKMLVFKLGECLSWDCYSKKTIDRVALTTDILSALETGKSEITVPVYSGSGEDCLPVFITWQVVGGWMEASSCVSSWPIMRALLPWPKHLPKTSSPNSTTLGN